MENHKRAMSAFVALAFIGAMLVAPALADEHTPDEVNVPFIGVTTVYAEDFAGGDGGFTMGGTAGTWEFGEPTSPPEIPEGKNPNVWATNLEGDHDSSDCGWIDSPAIDLSGVPAGDAMLSFKHWIDARMSSFSSNAYSGGLVLVSSDGVDYTPIDPAGGYDSDGVFSGQASCLGVDSDQGVFTQSTSYDPAADEWRVSEFDVSDYVGGDLHVRWFFGAGGTSITELGWYVDQVAVQVGGGGQSVDLPPVPNPEELDPNEHLPERVNVPSVPLQTLYAQDFAEGDGNYTTGGVDSSWEFGEPTSPPEIPEGKNRNVWGTNLDGDYTNRECSYLQSAPIDLSGVPVGNAMLSFKHWMHARMSSFSGTAFDGGIVMVSADGVDWTPIDPLGDGYNSDGASFSLRSCLGIGTDQDAFSGTDRAADEWDIAEFDVSEFIGGDLHVRWAFGSTSSFSSERGWYVDQVAVQLSVGGQNIEVPEVPDVDPTSPPTIGLPAPGWTIAGEDPSWQYGTVTDPDPDMDEARGETGFKTNLAGPHNNPECSTITSPVMPASVVAANPSLSWEQAYRIAGAFVDVAWGGGLVMVSLDAGVTWNYLDLPEYDRPLDYTGGYVDCFTRNGAPIDGNVFSGVNTELHTVDVDLLDHFDQGDLDNATGVQFRYLFGAQTFAYEGWFINHVDAAGVRILN